MLVATTDVSRLNALNLKLLAPVISSGASLNELLSLLVLAILGAKGVH